MWNGVTSRFGTFCGNIRLTQEQLDDGFTKSKGIISTLNRAYWGHNDERQRSVGGVMGKDHAGTAASRR